MTSNKTIDDREPTLLPYTEAIDVAFKLDKDDPDWKYRVEIESSTGLAKIAVLEDGELLGYL